MAENYGYIYAYDSSEEENCLESLRQFSIPDYNIYTDKREESKKKRPKYKRLMKTLHKGDTLYINSLNCLGDNYNDIQEQWRTLTRMNGVGIIVLDIPLLDTSRGNEWMKNYTSDLVTELLSFVAINEHTKLKKRQAEGIEEARKKGVHLGRPLSDLPDNFESKCYEWKSGEISCSEAARECGMPLSSFRYRAKIYFESENEYKKVSNL